MKKFVVIVFVAFVFLLCSFNNQFFNYLLTLDENASVSFYCTTKNQNNFLNETQNGDGFVYSVSVVNAGEVYESLMGCYGFSVRLGLDAFDNVIEKVSVVKTEVVGDTQNFYGAATGLMFFDFLDNKKINIQIAKTQNSVVVGSPIILGAY